VRGDMKILYVCHRVPYPPKRGGKIRPFNMIRHFSEQGHQVTVASLARDARELEEAADLKSYCSQVIVETVSRVSAALQMAGNVPTTRPSSFGYFWSPRLAQRIRAHVEQSHPDLIFAHCSSVAPYVAYMRDAAKIIDFGDMDSQKWREYSSQRHFPLSLVYWLEAIKLERAERACSGLFDLATCTTAAELRSLQTLGAMCPSDWFPNGVDCNYFAPNNGTYDPNTIAFVGRMDYFPNQQGVRWFCEQVWPLLRSRLPALKFKIVGADPSSAIRALAHMDGVTVTGSVADVRPYVHNAALTVAPLSIARGTQNKILESMAAGTPVVCSPEAAGGVDAIAGEHLLVADSPAAWVGAICGVLADATKRSALSEAARARVLAKHSWAASMLRMDGLVESVVQRKK
jgi:polysaccharide biosynthesis protein PslH